MSTPWPTSRRACLQLGLAATASALAQPAFAHGQAGGATARAVQFLRTQMDRLKIPGLSVVVVRDGRPVFSRAMGTASIEFDQPVRADTVFAINSVTKAFTGVAAMRLVDQGKLDLSDPVGRHVADLPEAWKGIPLHQLLTHMSGLPDIMRAPTVETDAAAAWAWTLAQPIRFAPGDRFNYCQTNYTLIQKVLNRLHDRAADAPLALEQLQLSGMTRTWYGDAYDVIPRRAPTYRWALPGPFITGYSAAAPDAPRELKATSERFLPFRRASSGLNSTAEDLARWMIALTDGRLLTAQARERMWTPGRFNDGTAGQWGIGWEILRRGEGRCIKMTGGGRAAVCLYPDARTGVVVLTNLTGSFPEDLIDALAAMFAPEIDMAGVPALRIALEDQGYAAISEAARRIERDHPNVVWPEAELNDWGYRLLSTGRRQDALPLFRFLVERYPQSANAHDSYAQAAWVNGDTATALTHYQRALALDPGNSHAPSHIETLRQAGAGA